MFTTSLIFCTNSFFSGKVVDEQNLSLPEQITCKKGKTTSVVTDMNGNFEMQMQTVKPLLQSLTLVLTHDLTPQN
jgi:hypothetical protein